MWAFSQRHTHRAYSTSDDDYLVEEDEEKMMLGAQPGGTPTTDSNQSIHVMNPEFRALRRYEFLFSSQRIPHAKDVEELLERASSFPSLDDIPRQDSWWIKKFARLNAIYDVRLPMELRTSHLEVNALTEQVVKSLLRHGSEVNSIRGIWITNIRSNYSPEGKRNVWCEMLLWLLYHDQNAVLPVLEATGRGPKAPSYIVADILEHLISKYLQNVEVGNSSLPAGFLRTLAFLLEQNPCLGRTLSQKFVHLSLVHSTLDEGLKLWDLLRQHGFRPSWHTFYHLAYFFGRHGQYEKALEALKRPIELGAPPTHWAFLATCAQVLRSSATKAEAYHASIHILSSFIQMGVPLNIYLYTIFMHNAVDHGDVQTALDIFHLLREKEVEPNDYTFTVLLKGLKDGGNVDVLTNIIREARQALPKLKRPEVVATDILHCIYLKHYEPACTERAFADLAKTYLEYFDPSPLVKLGIPARFFGKVTGSDGLHMTPPYPAIGIVMGAYLELVSPRDPEGVVRLYRTFRHRIENLEDPFLPQLGDINYFYNAFLLAMGQNAVTIQLIPEVLRQMTDRRIHSVPLTTKHTWDILVNAFMRHKLPEAAERVMQTASAYGAEPNEVTWNSLVRGYARLQDVDKALDTIRQMQLKKISLSPFSLAILGRMKKSDMLSQGLREMEEIRQRQLEEENDYLVPDDYEGPATEEESDEDIGEKVGKEMEEDGGNEFRASEKGPMDTNQTKR